MRICESWGSHIRPSTSVQAMAAVAGTAARPETHSPTTRTASKASSTTSATRSNIAAAKLCARGTWARARRYRTRTTSERRQGNTRSASWAKRLARRHDKSGSSLRPIALRRRNARNPCAVIRGTCASKIPCKIAGSLSVVAIPRPSTTLSRATTRPRAPKRKARVMSSHVFRRGLNSVRLESLEFPGMRYALHTPLQVRRTT